MGKLELKDLYVNFSGAGNPNSKYWFFSIEPGGDCEDFRENLKKNRLCIVDEEPKAFYKRLNTLIQKLPNECESIIDKSGNVKIDSNTSCFKSDIFMLNFPNKEANGFKKVKDCYKKIFDEFNSGEVSNRKGYEDFLLKLMKDRYEKNFQKFLTSPPQKVVFLLTVNEDYFKHLKNLLNVEKETIKKVISVKYIGERESTVTFYNFSGFILVRTPHLSRWSKFDEQVESIVTEFNCFYKEAL